MKTSGTWNFRTVAGRMMMGLVFAAMIFSIDAVPAIGKRNDDNRMEKRNKGYYENADGRRVYRHSGYKKQNRGHYETVNGRRVYRPYGYRERTYVAPPTYYTPPPPVYYEPPPPGIRIFFPPIYLH